MTSSNRCCPMPASALEILEPIADRCVLPTVWPGFLCARYPTRAYISARLGDLANASHQPSLIPATTSDSTTIKSP